MMIRSFEWRTRAYVATRRNVTRPLRDTRACPPSHLITHYFCALSRYGVTTVRSFPLTDFRWHPGCRSFEISRSLESLLR